MHRFGFAQSYRCQFYDRHAALHGHSRIPLAVLRAKLVCLVHLGKLLFGQPEAGRESSWYKVG